MTSRASEDTQDEAAAPAAKPESPVQTGRVHGVVAAHLEPVTRFGAGDLLETEPEQGFGVALQLTLDQSVDFEISCRSGAASLSSNIDVVSGASAMQSELDRRLNAAREGAPLAIKAWVDQEPGSYRRLLPGQVAFRRTPGAVGYEHACTTCAGTCRVTCQACSGQGNTLCYGCSGLGRINCYSCYGRKKISCSYCSGRGSWTEQITTQSWNSATSSYDTNYRSEYRSCSSCSASGQTTCYSCEYDGKIGCAACFARGRLDCGPCRATGLIDCGACLASGIQHVWGTIAAKVERSEQLSVAHGDEGLRRQVHDLLPLADLPALGELINVQHAVKGGMLRSEHRLRLDVLRASISALGAQFVIHGFGPKPTVYSFENIAGQLLTEDLEVLEQSAAGSSRWRRHKGSDLLDTMAAFLRSELNMLIAERVADLKATPQRAAEQVQQHFRGLVDSAYVERATTALREALARLYGSELLEPAAYLCGLTAVAAGLLFSLGWPLPGPWSAAACSLGGAVLAWCALEWLTRRRMARRFDPAFAQRVLAQLAANGSRRRWRFGVGTAAIAAAALGIVGSQQLPVVRRHQADQQALIQAEEMLSRWNLQASADFRQRQYPSRELLDSQVARGDTRAQLILAWQLLLGAGGATKDVQTAAQLLDQAQASSSGDPLWKAAKAVHLLNQEAMPDAIRAAAADLAGSADLGLTEARYWLARIYLEERSPAYDARRGLQALTQAADQGHARAAMLLGQRLATGKGVRRDVSAARRYLQRAASEGLAEAQAALAKLR